MYQISKKEYEEYRMLKAGINDWISEAEVMELTGWKKSTIDKYRQKGKLKTRTIKGRKHQYSKSHINSMFTYSN